MDDPLGLGTQEEILHTAASSAHDDQAGAALFYIIDDTLGRSHPLDQLAGNVQVLDLIFVGSDIVLQLRVEAILVLFLEIG